MSRLIAVIFFAYGIICPIICSNLHENRRHLQLTPENRLPKKIIFGGSMRFEIFKWEKGDLDLSRRYLSDSNIGEYPHTFVFATANISFTAHPYILILHDVYNYSSTLESCYAESSYGCSDRKATVTLILRPIEDSETVTELIGTGADLNIVPKLIWGNEKGMQDFQTKQIQHYRSRAAGSKVNVHVVFELGDPVPSLKVGNINPDNIMRVIYQKMSVLNPPSHIGFEECRACRKNNADGYFNPTFALWQRKVLASWACPKSGFIRLAWYDPKGDMASNGSEPIVSERLLSLGPEERSGVMGGYLGIGPDTSYPHLSKSMHDPSVVYLVDSRLLSLSDGSLHITYTSVQLPEIVNVQYLTVRSTRDSSGNLIANFSVPRQLGNGQKNWVSFEIEDGRVLHLQRINPMHVVEAIDITGEDGKPAAEIRTIYKADQKVALPWHDRFGAELRGGTPAVLVTDNSGRKLYLSIFHTKAYCQHPFKLFTYFINCDIIYFFCGPGAMTLCPNSPYRIHTISKHPILNDDIYQGPWLWNTADYIFYPAGLIVEDGVVWVSAGYQNIQLRVYRMDLFKLLHSLDFVADC